MACVRSHRPSAQVPPISNAFLSSCLRLIFLFYYNPATPFSQLRSSPVLGTCEAEFKFLGSSIPLL